MLFREMEKRTNGYELWNEGRFSDDFSVVGTSFQMLNKLNKTHHKAEEDLAKHCLPTCVC